MIERVLWDVLTNGIQALTEDPDQLVTFFCEERGLSPEESKKIRDYFLEKPPSVIHGYARSDSKFPLYAITLGNESTSTQFLGDEGEFIDDPDDPDFGADERAMFFDETFNILIYSENPNITLYYYQLARWFLLSNIDYLKSHDLFNIRFSGSDMAPDPAWVPAGLFLRRLTVMATEAYSQVDAASKAGRAWKVGGLHVDFRGAMGEDVGGVKTLVTPIDPRDSNVEG